MSKKLISDFDTSNSLEEIYSLPQTVASETSPEIGDILLPHSLVSGVCYIAVG